jgi:hypothetical protein
MNAFKEFAIGKTYSFKEIKEHLKKQGVTMDHSTSYTYNRWNKGTPRPQPFFEYLGKSKYKYIGPPEESKYSGRLVHNPKGSKPEYQVGEWSNAKLKYVFPNISSFKEWKKWLGEVEHVG